MKSHEQHHKQWGEKQKTFFPFMDSIQGKNAHFRHFYSTQQQKYCKYQSDQKKKDKRHPNQKGGSKISLYSDMIYTSKTLNTHTHTYLRTIKFSKVAGLKIHA